MRASPCVPLQEQSSPTRMPLHVKDRCPHACMPLHDKISLHMSARHDDYLSLRASACAPLHAEHPSGHQRARQDHGKNRMRGCGSGAAAGGGHYGKAGEDDNLCGTFSCYEAVPLQRRHYNPGEQPATCVHAGFETAAQRLVVHTIVFYTRLTMHHDSS